MRVTCTLLFACSLLLAQACGGGGSPTVTPAATGASATGATSPAAATPAGSPVPPIKFIAVLGGPPGGRARVTVQGIPKVLCGIRYFHPSGKASLASGLEPKKAEADGTVSWGWVISTDTRAGAGTVTVTCADQTISSPIQIK
jgi:hypothetical protein